MIRGFEMDQDVDRSYIDLAVEESVRPASDLQIKQQEIDILKNKLNSALKAIDSIQNLLTEQTKDLELFMTDINNELKD